MNPSSLRFRGPGCICFSRVSAGRRDSATDVYALDTHTHVHTRIYTHTHTQTHVEIKIEESGERSERWSAIDCDRTLILRGSSAVSMPMVSGPRDDFFALSQISIYRPTSARRRAVGCAIGAPVAGLESRLPNFFFRHSFFFLFFFRHSRWV